MFRIGCVNIDTSHPGCFAQTMKEANLSMAYTAVFSDSFRTDEEINAFMKDAGVKKRFDSLEKMAEEVDIAFIHDCNWDKHIEHAMPFIEAGKLVYLDKPIVGNLVDCFKLEELVKKGAAILGGSSLRYSDEVTEFRKSIGNNNEKIATIFGTCGTDEFNYGIHLIEFIHGLLGAGIYSTTYLGASRSGNNPAEQYLVKWNNGIQVIYQIQFGQWQPCHIVVTTDKAIHHKKVDTSKLYLALLKRIDSFLSEGKPLASITELMETIKAYLAGKKSRERGGQEIAIHNLSLTDNGFDGSAFEKDYAIKQTRK